MTDYKCSSAQNTNKTKRKREIKEIKQKIIIIIIIMLLYLAFLILIIWKGPRACGQDGLLQTSLTTQTETWVFLILSGLAVRQAQNSGRNEMLLEGFFAVASTGKWEVAAIVVEITELQELNPAVPPGESPNGGCSLSFTTPSFSARVREQREHPNFSVFLVYSVVDLLWAFLSLLCLQCPWYHFYPSLFCPFLVFFG